MSKSKLEILAQIDSTKDEARSKLVAALPQGDKKEAYSTLDIKTTKLSNESYLVVARYKLKSGYENKVQAAGAGSYISPMELAVLEREQSL